MITTKLCIRFIFSFIIENFLPYFYITNFVPEYKRVCRLLKIPIYHYIDKQLLRVFRLIKNKTLETIILK